MLEEAIGNVGTRPVWNFYVCVCLFVCLFVWLVGWLVGWLFGCLFVCLFVFVHAWMDVCTYMYVYVYVYVCMYASVCICMCMHVYVCMRVCVCVPAWYNVHTTQQCYIIYIYHINRDIDTSVFDIKLYTYIYICCTTPSSILRMCSITFPFFAGVFVLLALFMDLEDRKQLLN